MRSIFLLFVVGYWPLFAPVLEQRNAKSPPVKARVTLFLSTECPISQQYTRRLRELHKEFSGQGVQFAAYFPLSTDNKLAINQFQRDYPLPFPLQSDAAHQQVRRFRASIVPEVVVQDASGMVVYQGPIDDWFYSLGKHRPEPTQHYLRNALIAIQEGRPMIPPKTEAVGCFIE
ncbi:MAG: redoxin domain-containing protein [Rudanella sp.]|nr:redoxin domain-containing protein [Rudanella sp.]